MIAAGARPRKPDPGWRVGWKATDRGETVFDEALTHGQGQDIWKEPTRVREKLRVAGAELWCG